MANLFELSKSISPAIIRVQQRNVVRERMMSAYRKRMEDLGSERDVFDKCKNARPDRRKYRNTLFKEQCGTIGEHLTVRHFDGSYISVTCRAKNIY